MSYQNIAGLSAIAACVTVFGCASIDATADIDRLTAEAVKTKRYRLL